MPSVEFELEDYESDIKREYCKGNCLIGICPTKLIEYIQELEKVHIYKYYTDNKTIEQIVSDLADLIKE